MVCTVSMGSYVFCHKDEMKGGGGGGADGICVFKMR